MAVTMRRKSRFPKKGGCTQARGLMIRGLGTVIACSLITAPWAAPVALAQSPTSAAVSTNVNPNAEMLLEADDLTYDYDRDKILARGKVQIFYDGYTLEADEVIFDRGSARMFAKGNVKMAEPDGNIITTQEMELTDNFAEGFARSLQVDSPQRTRFIAESANREGSNVTTFNNGLYTVYTRQPAEKPPLWRLRAQKIIHNQEEKVVRFEDTRLEFFGMPVAYIPYLSMPDPSVKRKSGFLTPTASISSNLGYGLTVPYYLALDPHYDLTVAATGFTKQGALGTAVWRQELEQGKYLISGALISQKEPSAFLTKSGNRRWRGVLHTEGDYVLFNSWSLAWNLTYKSDRSFLSDYQRLNIGGASDVSQVSLSRIWQRNAVSVYGYAFSISQEDYNTTSNAPIGPFERVGAKLQDKQPYVFPVADVNYVFDQPIAGGELSFKSNFTSLTRAETDAYSVNGENRYRGVDGTFSRWSVNTQWRRTLIDPIGQMFTPFAYVRGDLFFLGSQDKNVTTLTDEAFVGRVMPAVGLEYRYPFIASFNGGNQIIEPIAQIIVRPDEQRIGELPNEDAQSLVFDTTTLFAYDKFSGYDRVEGGTRANLGLSYKFQLDSGEYLSTLFGRSFHLSGRNSFEKPDLFGSSLESGLETGESDYVAGFALDTRRGVTLGSQARFDEQDLSVRRLQVQATGSYGPVVSTFAYAFMDKQPQLGINNDREEVLASSSLRIAENWRLFGGVRYDLKNENIVQDSGGVGYDDEGFSMSLSYQQDRSRNNGEPVNRTVFFRFGLRTIGDTQVSSSANQ
ncbi:LPS-assembly protein LptD [Pannonibacter sp. Pt2]|uniref:LPS-assembly protein LptD n=1 Tax=Pannonibacter anstelovis TaxID=3121537 RepID=A0ABU7ZIV3_9HYPH